MNNSLLILLLNESTNNSIILFSFFDYRQQCQIVLPFRGCSLSSLLLFITNVAWYTSECAAKTKWMRSMRLLHLDIFMCDEVLSDGVSFGFFFFGKIEQFLFFQIKKISGTKTK